tara:strand:+ start:657 stop:785 length:129 start_codon:yes stop_codon:yes gene_type:complete
MTKSTSRQTSREISRQTTRSTSSQSLNSNNKLIKQNNYEINK